MTTIAPPKTDMQLQYVPIDRIQTTNGNPRKAFDPDQLRELADDIAAHGLLQPITVAPINADEDGYEYKETLDGQWNGRYTIIAGERRFRAVSLLEWDQVPAVIHPSVTREEQLELALVENLQRVDLNPMEEAMGYAQLHDRLGLSHEDIAAKVNRSRPAVSNAVRLLQLPEDVQALVSQGKLSRAHGIALLKWAAFPEACSELARLVLKENAPVKDIEGHLGWQLRNPLRGKLKSVTMAPTSSWNREEWHCPSGCKNRIGELCFNAKEHAAKKRDHKQKVLAKQEKEIANAQAKAEKAGEPPLLAQRPKDAIQIVPKRGYYYQDEAPAPTGCTEKCPCRVQAKDTYGGLKSFCTDKKRFNALTEEAKEKADRRRSEKADALDDAAVAICKSLDLGDDLLYILWASERATFGNNEAVAKLAADHISDPTQRAKAAKVVSTPNKLADFLAGLPQLERLRFLTEYMLRTSIDAKVRRENVYGSGYIENPAMFIKALKSGAVPDSAEVPADTEDDDDETPACRVCGCTEFAACETEAGMPCSWVEDPVEHGDLCSACLPGVLGAAGLTEPSDEPEAAEALAPSSNSCVRCHKSFPISDNPERWKVGEMLPLTEAPKVTVAEFLGKLKPDERYLCGDCYFELDAMYKREAVAV